MIKTYRKIVTVQALQWNGENLSEVIEFIGLHPSALKWSWKEYEQVVVENGLKIFTKEGSLKIKIGDYVLKGHHGEAWPCDKQIFEESYQEVDNPREDVKP